MITIKVYGPTNQRCNLMNEQTKIQLQLDRCSRYLFFARGILPQQPIFVDVGSRTGIHALALADKFDGTTIVYEANEKNHSLLSQAVSGSKILTHQLAVTGKDGETDFFEFVGGCSDSVYPRHKQDIGPDRANLRLIQKARVKSTSVESILSVNNVPHIDVLFCNCEGAELGIIDEIMSKPNLRHKIRQLCVSFHGGRIYAQTKTTNAIGRMSEFFLMTTEVNEWPCHLFINKNMIQGEGK